MAYRDVFYRAFRKDEKTMHKVDELVWGEDGESRWVRIGDHLLDPTRVELMEYTGMKDKNGTMIFEGDIVHYLRKDNTKFDADYERTFTITFEDGSFKAGDSGIVIKNIAGDNAEVIGNIYETPPEKDIINTDGKNI